MFQWRYRTSTERPFFPRVGRQCSFADLDFLPLRRQRNEDHLVYHPRIDAVYVDCYE